MKKILKKALLKRLNQIRDIIKLILLLYFLLVLMLGSIFMIFTVGSRNTAILPAPEEDMVLEYKKIAEMANLDWADMIIFDTVRYENDFDKADPKETGWEFLFIKYELQMFTQSDDGPYWATIESGILTNRRSIVLFCDQNLQHTKDNLIKVIDTFNKHNMRIFSKYYPPAGNSISHRYIFEIGSIDLEDVMEEHNFNEDQKDWARLLISENFVYEMFGEMLGLPKHIPVPGDSFFVWPTPTLYSITSSYGWRIHPTTKERAFHYGIDIAGNNAHGQAVISVADGEVFQVNYSSGVSGYNIRIRHYDEDGNEWQSRYCHLSQMTVKVGDKVKQGDVIGAVGNTGRSTGPHLHFELKFEGQLVDPYPFIR